MKTCERCGGTGAYIEYAPSVTVSDEPKPCPCLTDRLAAMEQVEKHYEETIPKYHAEIYELREKVKRLERVAELAQKVVNGWFAQDARPRTAVCFKVPLIALRAALDVRMTNPRSKYLKKVFHRLWFSNWSSGEHLRILNRVIFGRRGV